MSSSLVVESKARAESTWRRPTAKTRQPFASRQRITSPASLSAQTQLERDVPCNPSQWRFVLGPPDYNTFSSESLRKAFPSRLLCRLRFVSAALQSGRCFLRDHSGVKWLTWIQPLVNNETILHHRCKYLIESFSSDHRSLFVRRSFYPALRLLPTLTLFALYSQFTSPTHLKCTDTMNSPTTLHKSSRKQQQRRPVDIKYQ